MYDLLRQSSIKTDHQLMMFYDEIYQYCPDTVRSTVAYILFYQDVPIDNFTHVPDPVEQSSSDSEYNAA